MKISKEYKIGIFAVVVLATSFFVINFLRGKDIFGKEMELVSYFDDVEGLLPSCPVYIKGYKAGTVSDVTYNPEDAKFKVECSVAKKFNVPEDSRMIIYSVDIMGGKGVRIDFGTSDVPAAQDAVLEGGSEPDLISSLSSAAVPLLAGLSGVVDSLSITVSSVNKMLEGIDPGSLKRTVAHLESTMANVRKISAGIGGKSEDLETFIENLNLVSVKLNSVMEKADTTMSGLSSVVGKLDSSDIEGLVSSFRSLIEKIQDPDGSLGKLISEGEVYENIESLLADVDSLVQAIKDNPKKYIKITIF